MEKAIIISRCSTNENRQDITRQSQELTAKYGNQYDVIKEFSYYQSGTKNDEVNAEILDYAIKNDVKHILTLEVSRISRKISSFSFFMEQANQHKINIIIDNFKLHTLLPDGKVNTMVQTMLSIASTFASMELTLIKERLNSGRDKYIKGGGKLGRSKNSTKSTKQLLSEHTDIVKFVKQNQSVRNIMLLTGKSSGTVQKVRKVVLNAA